jgi:hypothetical protein
MIHYKQLSFIFLSSSLEQHAQIASDALEFPKPNQSHVQSNFGALFIYFIGVTGRDIPDEGDEVRLAVEVDVYFEIW